MAVVPNKAENLYRDLSSPYYLHHSDSPGALLVSQQLDGNNYGIWSRQVKVALNAKNKIGFVDGCVKKPDADCKEYVVWTRCGDMVKSWLFNSIIREISDSIIYANTSAEVWSDLRGRFTQSNAPREYQLRREITLCNLGSSSISSYYTRLKTLWEELTSLEDAPACTCGASKLFQEKAMREYLIAFLMELNDGYKIIRDQLLIMDPLPKVQHTYSLLLQEECQQSVSDDQYGGMENSAMTTQHVPSFPSYQHGPSASATQHVPSSPSYQHGPSASAVSDQHNNRANHFSHMQGKNQRKMSYCDYYKMAGHYRDKEPKCFKLYGFPPGHKNHRPKVGGKMATSWSGGDRVNQVPPSLTIEQYQRLLAMLKECNNGPSVNVAGPHPEDADWSG